MTQDQFLGLLRAVLAALAGLVIGHGLANQTVWEAFSGFVITGGTAYWSWRTHALTTDAILGVIRAAIGAIGGWLVFRNYASPDQVALWGAVILAAAPAGWSYSAHSPASPNMPAPQSPSTGA